MQNREAEIQFAKYGHQLQPLIFHLFHEWTKKLHEQNQRFRKSGQHFDQQGSKHHFGHTLLGQVKVDYIEYLAKNDQVEIIEITMGHDQNWKAVISVCSTNSEPVTIPSKGNCDEDILLIKAEALRCFNQSGLDMN
ncbi:MAG: hypothetical protein WDN00_00400 [Limisphaerales bacterium]